MRNVFKRKLLAGASLLMVLFAAAQPGYPVSGTKPVLQQAEYFFDDDPGLGNGRSISLPALTDVASLTVPVDLTGLRDGVHRLYVRSKDEAGHWSLTSTFVFSNISVKEYPVAETAAPITEMEYFLDSDPGFGNGIPVTLPVTRDLSAHPVVINLAEAVPGIHQLYVRTRDEAGRWSLTGIFYFDNTQMTSYPSAGPLQPLSDIEYYIDTDPGYGNGTPVSFTSGTDVANISFQVPLTVVSPGPHVLHLRSRGNPWSLDAWMPFNYGTPLPLTWLYVRGEMKTEGAKIDWATATESRTDSFFIEHSTDGRAFRAVGKMPAAGNSQQTSYYQFTHTQPQPGMNYYRIRQTDDDNRFTYSDVISLMNLSGLKAAGIAPNPVKNTLYVAIPQGKRVAHLELYNAAGFLLLRKQESTDNSLVRIPVDQFGAGIYVLKIFYDGGGLESLKFVKE